MKLKNAFIFSLIFMLLYVLLTIIISFSTFSFGYSDSNRFYAILKLFINFPISAFQEGTNSKIFFIVLFINGFIWGIIFWLVGFYCKKLLVKNK